MLLRPPDELFSLGGVEEEARSVFVLLSQSLRLGRFCLQTLRISKKKFSKKIIYVAGEFRTRVFVYEEALFDRVHWFFSSSIVTGNKFVSCKKNPIDLLLIIPRD